MANWRHFGFLLVFGSLLVGSARGERALTFDELYDPGKLLDVQITVPEADWNTIRKQTRSFAQALGEARREGKAPSPFSYVTAAVTINGVAFQGIGLRKKGFIGSLDNERPSLKVKFNHSDADARVAGLSQLTLNNNKQDGALVSQTMTYDLFRKAGLPASRTSYAKVSVNGRPLGIYTNVESARQPLIERAFESPKGTLFEGTIVDFYPGWAGGFEHKFGKKKRGRKAIEKLIAALEGPDDQLVSAVEAVVDLDAFLKFWALESLIGFWDGYAGNQNNFFVFHHAEGDRLHFLPWGADSVFTSRGMFDRGGPQSVKARGRLASRLYEIPEMRTRYREALLQLLETVWDEDALQAETERIEALVADSVHERQAGFPEALERTRDFFASRREQIMEEIGESAPEIEPGSSEPMYFASIGKLSGTFSGKWYDNEPGEPTEVGEVDVTVELDGKPVTFKRMGVHAVMGRFGFRGPGQPNINLVGEREDTGEQVTLMLMVDEDSFAPSGDDSVSVGGMMRTGAGFGFGPGGMQPIDGKIRFSAAAREEGAPVKATVDASIMKMVGGFFGRGRGGGGRGPGGPGGGRRGGPPRRPRP